MNFDGYTPYPIERVSSLVEQDDPTNLPVGVSPAARNIKFELTSARTRDGLQNQYGFALPDGGAVTGLAALKVGGPQGDLQVPIAFSALGDLYIEYPVGSGQAVQITGNPVNAPLVLLPNGASMTVAAAYAKGFLAFGNLQNSLGLPAVYNPLLKTLDPCSMLPVGASWQANTNYSLGECVTPATPVGGNGRLYQCTQAGVSGAVQPNFPAVNAGPNSPGSGVNVEVLSGSTPWMDPGNVNEQDGLSFASVTLIGTGDAGCSQNLAATDFGFAIPPAAKIVAVQVSATAEETLSAPAGVPLPSFPFPLNVFLSTEMPQPAPPVFGGSQQVNPSLNGPATFTLVFSGVGLTPAMVNANAFGILLAINCGIGANSTGATLSLQNVMVQILYTLAETVADNTVIWTDVTPTVSASPLPGQVAFGLRYMIVMFINRNGYISGWNSAAVASTTLPDSLHQITATFPTGPANTVARLLAFTSAGQLGQLQGFGVSSAGPYFWIDPNFPNGIFNLSAIPAGVTIAEVVSGVSMSSTLINDNVTTQATLNFTDDYLEATLNDVSAYFRKIQIPGVSDVFYSPTLDRMFYAADNLPSGWYVSLQGDPESVYGDTGLIQPAQNNGENRVAVRDYAGVCYLMKEKSGYALSPNAGDPSTWAAVPQWNGSGPCGPRAVDVGNHFMCFVHRSGVYIFQGNKPFRISKEIPITWRNINWAYKQTIWVMIDDETQEIRIGVPYQQSTVPNLILKCNYEELAQEELTSSGSVWQEHPIHFSPYIGKEIASGACYKWSIDDIAANVCVRAERILVDPPPTMDLPTTQSQILLGSSAADGTVAAIIPWTLDDNGAGIDSYVETACPEIMDGDGKVVKSLMAPARLGGVQANIIARGGPIYVEVLALRAKEQRQGGPPPDGVAKATYGEVIRLAKPVTAGIPYSCGGRMTNERMRLRVTNDKQPGVGFTFRKAWIYAQPISTARPS